MRVILFLQLIVLTTLTYSMYLLPSNVYLISVLSIFVIFNTVGLFYYVFRMWFSNIKNGKNSAKILYTIALVFSALSVAYLLINLFKFWIERYSQDVLTLFLNTVLIILSFLVVSFGIAYLTLKRELENQLFENEKLREKQLIFKLESLKSKLNPHFLFNSIAIAISMIDLDESKDKLKNYLLNITELLRMSIDAPEVWSVKEEFELASKYLNIQKERFNNFDFKIIVSEACLSKQIPSLILQPIIENSILHGISKIKEDGLITISCETLNDQGIVIEVKDNGKGAERISKGTGLTIVEERLNLFSKKSKLEYLSKINEGTCVKLYLE
ncbi:MAG: histidine kinase [Fervidobacterium sp.]|nr:histidine kinase [Fervidobacterium sp.]